ncbi:hypothetical protein [Ilumatobacter sp.]|uniref:hypothetical protein n=1 Tax=Ilumatobacter sp. TaxID=1967498 RepID=UPI003C6F198B
MACGLSITDAGFHPTTLTQWRNRLRKSDRPERIFDAVRDVIGSTNVLANKHRRALDSTLLDDAVETQDTVTQLVSMIRRVRKAVPEAAAAVVVGDDYEVGSGKPACAWNDPIARDELVSRLVNNALAVLAAVDGVELDEAQQQMVGLLALVAGQDVEPDETEGSWKIERKVARHRVISTVDPETRHMHKSRSSYRCWVGFVSNCQPAGVHRLGCGSKEAQSDRLESGVPTSVDGRGSAVRSVGGSVQMGEECVDAGEDG